MKEQAKSTLIYAALLLLAGIFHVTDVVNHRKGIYFPSTLMFSMITMIYSGLIMYWVQSVRRRLLPSPARSYTIASGMLMLLFLVVRTLNYRMIHSATLERWCWYIYYIHSQPQAISRFISTVKRAERLPEWATEASGSWHLTP